MVTDVALAVARITLSPPAPVAALSVAPVAVHDPTFGLPVESAWSISLLNGFKRLIAPERNTSAFGVLTAKTAKSFGRIGRGASSWSSSESRLRYAAVVSASSPPAVAVVEAMVHTKLRAVFRTRFCGTSPLYRLPTEVAMMVTAPGAVEV